MPLEPSKVKNNKRTAGKITKKSTLQVIETLPNRKTRSHTKLFQHELVSVEHFPKIDSSQSQQESTMTEFMYATPSERLSTDSLSHSTIVNLQQQSTLVLLSEDSDGVEHFGGDPLNDIPQNHSENNEPLEEKKIGTNYEQETAVQDLTLEINSLELNQNEETFRKDEHIQHVEDILSQAEFVKMEPLNQYEKPQDDDSPVSTRLRERKRSLPHYVYYPRRRSKSRGRKKSQMARRKPQSATENEADVDEEYTKKEVNQHPGLINPISETDQHPVQIQMGETKLENQPISPDANEEIAAQPEDDFSETSSVFVKHELRSRKILAHKDRNAPEGKEGEPKEEEPKEEEPKEGEPKEEEPKEEEQTKEKEVDDELENVKRNKSNKSSTSKSIRLYSRPKSSPRKGRVGRPKTRSNQHKGDAEWHPEEADNESETNNETGSEYGTRKKSTRRLIRKISPQGSSRISGPKKSLVVSGVRGRQNTNSKPTTRRARRDAPINTTIEGSNIEAPLRPVKSDALPISHSPNSPTVRGLKTNKTSNEPKPRAKSKTRPKNKNIRDPFITIANKELIQKPDSEKKLIYEQNKLEEEEEEEDVEVIHLEPQVQIINEPDNRVEENNDESSDYYNLPQTPFKNNKFAEKKESKVKDMVMGQEGNSQGKKPEEFVPSELTPISPPFDPDVVEVTSHSPMALEKIVNRLKPVYQIVGGTDPETQSTASHKSPIGPTTFLLKPVNSMDGSRDIIFNNATRATSGNLSPSVASSSRGWTDNHWHKLKQVYAGVRRGHNNPETVFKKILDEFYKIDEDHRCFLPENVRKRVLALDIIAREDREKHRSEASRRGSFDSTTSLTTSNTRYDEVYNNLHIANSDLSKHKRKISSLESQNDEKSNEENDSMKRRKINESRTPNFASTSRITSPSFSDNLSTPTRQIQTPRRFTSFLPGWFSVKGTPEMGSQGGNSRVSSDVDEMCGSPSPSEKRASISKNDSNSTENAYPITTNDKANDSLKINTDDSITNVSEEGATQIITPMEIDTPQVEDGEPSINPPNSPTAFIRRLFS
ncbi:hypothetical protein G9A89_014227 [Geosiphon pyriformis]|nr:hypothetical protein G9A89_014227 [Geosiphon pyriformis]